MQANTQGQQSRVRRHFILIYALAAVLAWANAGQGLLELLTPEFVEKYTLAYGEKATSRLEAWRKLISKNQNKDELVKLRAVNSFFNRKITYKRDIDHWHQEDYWATPIELLGTAAGDCEDYTIAKYFTLRALGVDGSKLRLMYVRALELNEAHMVLVYSENLSDIPLVLDNIKPTIRPANRRKDLKPIYSFNGDGLWLAKARGLGKKLRDDSGMAQWQDVISRIESGDLPTLID